MAATQTCTKCGRILPLTKDFFGHTPSKNFRRECRTCVAARVKVHAAANPDQGKLRAAARQERVANATGSYTKEDIVQLRIKQRDKCAYCNASLEGKGAIDHMTPIALKGSNSLHNLALACAQCNFEKHAKTVAQYFIWRRERKLQVSGTAFAQLRKSAL